MKKRSMYLLCALTGSLFFLFGLSPVFSEAMSSTHTTDYKLFIHNETMSDFTASIYNDSAPTPITMLITSQDTVDINTDNTHILFILLNRTPSLSETTGMLTPHPITINLQLINPQQNSLLITGCSIKSNYVCAVQHTPTLPRNEIANTNETDLQSDAQITTTITISDKPTQQQPVAYDNSPYTGDENDKNPLFSNPMEGNKEIEELEYIWRILTGHDNKS